MKDCWSYFQHLKYKWNNSQKTDTKLEEDNIKKQQLKEKNRIKATEKTFKFEESSKKMLT